MSKLGVGEGPPLAMLLAGPALSLPNMIVTNRTMKTNLAARYKT
ncbi:hypothetical protein [Methanosarcina siciliae]|nr:hypothetical protein [Methanosarcina siciliae]